KAGAPQASIATISRLRVMSSLLSRVKEQADSRPGSRIRTGDKVQRIEQQHHDRHDDARGCQAHARVSPLRLSHADRPQDQPDQRAQERTDKPGDDRARDALRLLRRIAWMAVRLRRVGLTVLLPGRLTVLLAVRLA